MATNLYELSTQYRLLLTSVEEADGELTAEAEARLAELDAGIEERIDACCSYEEELESTEDSITAAIKRLQDRKATIAGRRRRLKEHIRNCLERAGLSRVETTLFVARLQNSPPSATWCGDPDAIPPAFQRVKTAIEFDSRTAIAIFKAGGELPAQIEIRQGRHLVIK